MEPINCSNLAERRQKSIFSDILPESHLQGLFHLRHLLRGLPVDRHGKQQG